MLNQVVLVGRLARDLEIRNIDENKKVAEITLAVQRDFKNFDGQYDVDFIKCTLWDSLAESVSIFCKKGSMIAIKGRLQVRKITIGEVRFNSLELVGMRVTYLSVNKLSDVEEEDLEM